MEPEPEPRHHPEVAAAPTDRPEKIGVLVLIDAQDLSIGGNDFRGEQRIAVRRRRIRIGYKLHVDRRRHRFDRFTHARAFVPDDNDRVTASGSGGVRERVRQQRHAGHGQERFRRAGARTSEPDANSRSKNDGLVDRAGGTRHVNKSYPMSQCAIARLIGGARPRVHATFRGLPTSETARPSDRFEQDTVDILKRISRRPIEPTAQSELLADLGFDSLQVLELVGELEDHFKIAVPLNDLNHIRTVAQIVGEVRRLVDAQEHPA